MLTSLPPAPPVVPPPMLPPTITSTVSKPVTSQDDSLGIILPPSDIRNIVDKTAQFVAKNGPEFEQRVLLDKGAERKFSFLLPDSPYRAYYDAKVKQFLTGGLNEATQPQVPQAILEMKRREAEKAKKKEQLLALTAYATGPLIPNVGETREGLLKLTDFVIGAEDSRLLAIDDGRPPDPPNEDQFTAARPFAAALDIDIIKLTAQYVARNGQKFLVGLTQRERGNAQFSFIRATHPLFSYFTALVDIYTRCLVPDRVILARLKEDIGFTNRMNTSAEEDKIVLVKSTDVLTGPKILPPSQMTALLGIFERTVARQRWEEYEEKRKQEKAKEEAEEREQMHAFDWHEFLVVEVIQFTEEDDSLPLGPPVELAQLTQPAMIPPLVPSPKPVSPTQSVLSGSLANDAQIVNPAAAEIQQQPTSDEIYQENNQQQPTPTTVPLVQPVVPSLPLSQQHQGGFSDAPPETTSAATVPIMVVSDYVRQPKKRNRQPDGLMKCPITGQWIPSEQMTEHLRILLIDPKWKEGKDALIAKAQKGSAFAPNTDFEANLANFVVKRPDLFGSVDDECESTYVPAPKRK